MSPNFTDTFYCGDHAALVSYLYDECERGEREAIAAHLAGCVACAAEVEAIGATRRMLPAWTPPDAALGFQITSAEASARVLRPGRWWQRPLPAWAQAAAAAAIFVAGLSAGWARESRAPAEVRADGATERVEVAPVPSTFAPAPAPTVLQADLARLEQDLRAELARIEQSGRVDAAAARVAARRPDAASPEGVTMERVQALIEESERRQRAELIRGMGQVLVDVETQRRRDLAPMQRTVAGLGREAVTNRSSVAALVNAVSAQGGFRPVGGR